MTPFDVIKAICEKTSIKYDKKIASGYLLTYWLSYDTKLLQYVDFVNRHLLFKVDDDVIFDYYYREIPKGKRYIKIPKKG